MLAENALPLEAYEQPERVRGRFVRGTPTPRRAASVGAPRSRGSTAKVPLPAIQGRLGHESITTTVDRYGRLLDVIAAGARPEAR